VLLQAIPQNLIRPSELDSNQTAFLLNHKDPQVKQLAQSLLQTTTASERSSILANYQNALQLQGQPQTGRDIFIERCASCHRLGQEGHAVGPDLVSVRNNGRSKMLMNVIDPSLELLPQYTAYEVETNDGESFLGILIDETTHSLTLRQAFGTETRLLRDDIESISSSRKSLMPDGLETGLSPQDVANLLEYIFTTN
jgi:putative heme-binding domain-containing protein